MTPVKLDIDYNKYISLLYFKIGNSYAKLGNKEQAIFYLNKSLNLDPSMENAKQLLESLK
jgi:tetratricopeptide (TPR) repeat protein